MCGIICSIGFAKEPFLQALDKISHRGPNGSGHCQFHVADNLQLRMGHVRLSILDLDHRSNQPFTLNSIHFLTFNGEIYNFKELAKDLLKGVELITTSDTEVLWHLLRIYGTSVLSQLEGMFALSFYNSETKILVLARDSLGIKPLYEAQTEDGKIAYASEIKALKALGIVPQIHPNDIAEYIQFGFVHEPATGFKNIKKVSPGEIHCIDTTTLKVSKSRIPVKNIATHHLEQLIDSSIRIHQRADVPQCLLYSGGIDSSVLVSEMTNSVTPLIRASAEADVHEAEMTNDSFYAKAICNHLGLPFIEVEKTTSSSEFLSNISLVAEGVEELIGDYTFIASLDLCRVAKSNGFTVVHSGMGADEMFGGYPRYLAFKYIDKYPNLFKLLVPLLKRMGSKKSGRLRSAIEARNVWDKYFALISAYSEEEVLELLDPSAKQHVDDVKQKIWHSSKLDTNLKTAIHCDRLGFLSHNFIVADKSSMLTSVEMRVPLVCQTIYSWFLTSRDNQLIRFVTLKSELKSYLFQRIDRKFFKRKKAGFNPPLDTQIRLLGATRVQSLLNSTDLHSFINMKAVEGIVSRHYSKKENNTYKIFNLLFLASWIETHSPSKKKAAFQTEP